jgi:hypothetical protein
LAGKWGGGLKRVNYDGTDVLTDIAHDGLLKEGSRADGLGTPSAPVLVIPRYQQTMSHPIIPDSEPKRIGMD